MLNPSLLDKDWPQLLPSCYVQVDNFVAMHWHLIVNGNNALCSIAEESNKICVMPVDMLGPDDLLLQVLMEGEQVEDRG